MKRLVTTIAAFSLIAGCSGTSTDRADAGMTDAAGPDATAPEETQGAEEIPAIAESIEEVSAPDITISIKSDSITAEANIDGEIGAFAPTLGDRIKAEVEAAFDSAKGFAAEDANNEYFMPHDYQYDFIKTASVGDIISVEYMNMFFTGGAHPNYMIGGTIYDRASGEDVVPATLLSEDGKPKMRAFLMEELARKKRLRMSREEGDLPALREEVEEVFPKETEFWFGEVTLVPSLEADKFGGLVVHFSPYDVGPYAEGSYDLLVPASELEGMLSDAYAPMFGGEPDIEQPDEH